MRNLKIRHEGHGNNRKSLVHLPQVDIAHLPTQPRQQFSRRRHRRCRKVPRWPSMPRMAPHHRPYRQPPRPIPRHQHQRRRPVRDRRGIRRRHRAPRPEGGLQLRDLIGPGGHRGLIPGHHRLPLTPRHRHRRNLGRKVPPRLRLPRAHQRRVCKRILRRTGELERRRAILGKAAHQAAPALAVARIGILQPVQEHVVDHLGMPQPRPAPHPRQQIGRVGHALHPPRHDDIGSTQRQRIIAQHRGLHPRSAHLVDRGRRHAFRQARREPRLPRRGLPQTGRQHAAHQQILDRCPRQSGPGQRRPDRDAAQFRGRARRKHPLERPHGGPCSTCDDDLAHGSKTLSPVTGF